MGRRRSLRRSSRCPPGRSSSARVWAVHTGTTVASVDDEASTAHLAVGTLLQGLDTVLFAAGRRPRLDGLGLGDVGVDTTEQGVVADSWGRTSVDGIWAVGDIIGDTSTTHGANAIGRPGAP